MTILKSILQDIKSWDKIKLNKWHLHAPIALIIGCVLYYFLKDSVTDIYIISKVALKILVPSFLGFVGLFLFELNQQGSRIIGELERFESNKDLWVGEFFLVIGIILTYIIL